ncbi:hypothetical protein R1flu_021516 [Riccia fluitans]|uniref:Fe2OG dioxygenase domain-containing protein n=1 Tax=Riccia fluitans TaxID=41844 RepID=A0ABD1ZPT5_9MARC
MPIPDDVTDGADVLADGVSLKPGGLKTSPIGDIVTDDSPPEAEDGDKLSILVIDIAGLSADGNDVAVRRRKIVSEITHAYETWGIFQIINHGVSQQLVNDVHKQAHEFFSLPPEIKERIRVETQELSESNNYHQQGFLRKPADPMNTSWREDLAFSSSWNKSKGMIERAWLDMGASTVKTVHEYLKSMDDLDMKLLEILAKGLGLDSGFFLQNLCHVRTSEKPYYWQVNFHPPCQHTEQTIGIPPHSDPCILTLLSQENVSGLQAMKGGRYMDVLPTPGALVVNVGDLLEAWSNGRFQSAVHRVVVSTKQERVSWAFLMYPSHSVVVEAPKQLIDDEHPRLFKPLGHVTMLRELYEGVQAALKSGDTCKPLPKVLFYELARLNKSVEIDSESRAN